VPKAKLSHNKKKIIYYIDNMAVVSVLNSKTSTSARVMVLLRLLASVLQADLAL
jgi:heptaprenylglyceryl phosphate synthase